MSATITAQKKRESEYRNTYHKMYDPMFQSMKPVTEEQHNELVALCQKNIWLKRRGIPFQDDPLMELDYHYSFSTIEDIEMLKLYFEHGNWAIREGVVYKELFFCNQVNGGDEWWTCRYDPQAQTWVPFESVTFKPYYTEGDRFEYLINRMLNATVEQCAKLKY